MTEIGATDHRIGVTIALGAIALLAAGAMALTAGTPGSGTAFAVATIAGAFVVVALHAYPSIDDGH